MTDIYAHELRTGDVLDSGEIVNSVEWSEDGRSVVIITDEPEGWGGQSCYRWPADSSVEIVRHVRRSIR